MNGWSSDDGATGGVAKSEDAAEALGRTVFGVRLGVAAMPDEHADAALATIRTPMIAGMRTLRVFGCIDALSSTRGASKPSLWLPSTIPPGGGCAKATPVRPLHRAIVR